MTDTVAFEISGTGQKRSWDAGELPAVESLGQGIWSIPVPMPQNSLRYVLVYALELTDGVAIIDAGWDTDAARTALSGGLGQAGYALSDVKAVLPTHIHPDHYGLAGWVRENSGAWIGLHPADAASLRGRYVEMDPLLGQMRAHLENCGVPPEERDDMRGASMNVRPLVAFAEPDRLIEDGDRPELAGWDLRAVWTPGHSPGHLCFYSEDRRVLMSGDHVLPRITPNVSFHPQQSPHPLADFLESLAKVALLETDEVLPAHEYRFRGLAARVSQLVDHHEHRFSEIRRTLADTPGSTAWEVALHLTWSRPWENLEFFGRRAALGETLAHLMVLEDRGTVRRSGRAPERWELTGR